MSSSSTKTFSIEFLTRDIVIKEINTTIESNIIYEKVCKFKFKSKLNLYSTVLTETTGCVSTSLHIRNFFKLSDELPLEFLRAVNAFTNFTISNNRLIFIRISSFYQDVPN